MEREFVESTCIKSRGWEDNILELEFISGGIYMYYGVPKDIYNKFKEAESQGEFFHKEIRDNYKYEKI